MNLVQNIIHSKGFTRVDIDVFVIRLLTVTVVCLRAGLQLECKTWTLRNERSEQNKRLF